MSDSVSNQVLSAIGKRQLQNQPQLANVCTPKEFFLNLEIRFLNGGKGCVMAVTCMEEEEP